MRKPDQMMARLLHNRERLMQLLKANSERDRQYAVLRAKGDESAAEIFLYDPIGGWDGILAKDFVRDLAALRDVDKITLRINSPGGDVFEARAIVAAIKEHPAQITARVDGLAASAASYIALAASRVDMVAGSFLMIHNAWSIAIGDKHDMTAMADLLAKVDQTIVEDYQARTGQTAEQLQTWMDAETWFTPAEAVEHKFADAIIEGKAASAAWDLVVFDNVPAALQSPAPDTQASAVHAQRLRHVQLLERLG